jgi:hypothetical protein
MLYGFEPPAAFATLAEPRQGEAIAYSGTTGPVTGPHLRAAKD